MIILFIGFLTILIGIYYVYNKYINITIEEDTNLTINNFDIYNAKNIEESVINNDIKSLEECIDIQSKLMTMANNIELFFEEKGLSIEDKTKRFEDYNVSSFKDLKENINSTIDTYNIVMSIEYSTDSKIQKLNIIHNKITNYIYILDDFMMIKSQTIDSSVNTINTLESIYI